MPGGPRRGTSAPQSEVFAHVIQKVRAALWTLLLTTICTICNLLICKNLLATHFLTMSPPWAQPQAFAAYCGEGRAPDPVDFADLQKALERRARKHAQDPDFGDKAIEWFAHILAFLELNERANPMTEELAERFWKFFRAEMVRALLLPADYLLTSDFLQNHVRDATQDHPIIMAFNKRVQAVKRVDGMFPVPEIKAIMTGGTEGLTSESPAVLEVIGDTHWWVVYGA